jgi:hypothetical protein
LFLRRTLIFLLFAGLTSLPLSSQVRFVVKTGATAQLTPVYDMNYGTIRIEPEHTGGLGVHAGLSVYIGSEPVYVQPEVLFESVTFQYIVFYRFNRGIVRQSINKLYLPLLVGIQFDVMRIFFGPSVAIRTESPKALVNEADFSKLYSKTSLDYQVGFGLDLLKKIDLEVRYRAYLGKHYEGIQTIGYQTITLNKSNSSILLSIGYKF